MKHIVLFRFSEQCDIEKIFMDISATFKIIKSNLPCLGEVKVYRCESNSNKTKDSQDYMNYYEDENEEQDKTIDEHGFDIKIVVQYFDKLCLNKYLNDPDHVKLKERYKDKIIVKSTIDI